MLVHFLFYPVVQLFHRLLHYIHNLLMLFLSSLFPYFQHPQLLLIVYLLLQYCVRLMKENNH